MKQRIWIRYDFADKCVIEISSTKIEAEYKLPWIKIFTKVIKIPVLTKWNNKKQEWVEQSRKARR